MLTNRGFCGANDAIVELKRLHQHVLRADNDRLPEVSNPDLIKKKKYSGLGFGDVDVEFQIAVQAHRIQQWWNTWPSKGPTHLKRREVFSVFGDIVAKLTLLQPSSAASERVFSILVRLYGKQQAGALEDYKETGVMMKYNNRKS